MPQEESNGPRGRIEDSHQAICLTDYSATSIAAENDRGAGDWKTGPALPNYRAACCARSKKDFINKLGVVLEEADETSFWLELLAESGTFAPQRLASILTESTEIWAIVAASRITAAGRGGRGEDPADSSR